jgi:hypothetical protein
MGRESCEHFLFVFDSLALLEDLNNDQVVSPIKAEIRVLTYKFALFVLCNNLTDQLPKAL